MKKSDWHDVAVEVLALVLGFALCAVIFYGILGVGAIIWDVALS